MSLIKGKTVLITGGASGIGKLMGALLLQKGASALVIWDINPVLLAETEAELRSKGFTVHTYQVDVADLGQIRETAGRVLHEVGTIDILINNAGIIVGKYFTEHSHTEISKTMQINAEALMHIALCFLPGMQAKNSGHIVNIASAAGMLSNPKMSVYAASKWAVIGWSESLRLELEATSAIQVTTVTPSYIDTGMFAGVKAPLLLPLIKPDQIAADIIKAIEKNKVFLRAPRMVYTLPFAKGILPVRLFDWLVGKGLGVYKSMDAFSGRKPEPSTPAPMDKQLDKV
jgi:all-trans-retinol dehydrogenase (NAD+)